MAHGIKQCSCGKRISQCRCPGPRGPDGKRQPKPVEIVQEGCATCKGMKKRAPGDLVVMEEQREEQSKFDRFLERVKEAGVYIQDRSYRSRGDVAGPIIEVSWRTGGLTGGSCWGTTADTPLDSEAEPEFEALDKLLEALAPNISFLQYKNLCRDVLETDSDRSNDYYGNYTDYAVKRVRLRKLYDALVERGFLSSE